MAQCAEGSPRGNRGKGRVFFKRFSSRFSRRLEPLTETQEVGHRSLEREGDKDGALRLLLDGRHLDSDDKGTMNLDIPHCMHVICIYIHIYI